MIATQIVDGVVQEFLDGEALKDGQSIGVMWPDQFKENYKVIIISEIVPNGRRERAYIRLSFHGVSAPVSLAHLFSVGVEISKKPVW